MNGITYYKTQSPYRGDLTKNCSLNGNEIDSNFLNLEGRDIKNVQLDENTLRIGLYNGNTFNVDLGSHSGNSGINVVNVPLTDVTCDMHIFFSGLPSTTDPNITLNGSTLLGIQHCQVSNGKLKVTQNPIYYEQTEMNNITITPMNTFSDTFEMSFENNGNNYMFSFTIENAIFNEVGIIYNNESYGNIKTTALNGNGELLIDVNKLNVFNINDIFTDTGFGLGKVLFYEQATYIYDGNNFGFIANNTVFPLLFSYNLVFNCYSTPLSTSDFSILRFNA